jgi:hypothetical protein
MLPFVGGGLGFLFIFLGLRANRKKRLLQNLPTSKTTGVFIGLVELKGTAESENPFSSYLANRRCVHYRWSVEEKWSRTVTESYTDSNGKSRTRTLRESGWKTVDSGGETQPFYLRDEDGAVLIQPTGAKIEPDPIYSEYCGRGDPLYYGKGPTLSVMDSDHRRRFSEYAIPTHEPVFVVGKARERSDLVAPEIAQDDTAPMFLISTKSEDQVTSGYAWATGLWTFFGLLLAVGGTAIALSQGGGPAHNQEFIYAGIAGGYFVIWLIGWVWTVFNSLIDLRNRVQRAWSHVDVQLKRRHDLIPNLVSLVKALKNHEQEVQTQMAELRTQQNATAPGETGEEIQGLRPTLIALQEKYPELKTSAAFLDLNKQLSETENRIALARDYFNTIATHYNTRQEQVPDCYVARLGSLKPRPLLSAADFERQAVTFKFAD